MRLGLRLAPVVVALAALATIPTTALGAGAAAAATPGPHTCTGTQGSPGVLAGGDYTTVTINGVCEVNDGQVVASGTVTVTANSALIAAFANNDVSHTGTSGLSAGSIVVDAGATLILGCENVHFSCIDDPNQVNPTLNSTDVVKGSLTATNALGILTHLTTIGSDVIQTGGGGGKSCAPSGIFAAFMSPVYSDYEDDVIGGNLVMKGLTSCWLGALRNRIGGSVTEMGNTMADPDAMEVLTNQIAGNVICADNSPANQYGDSMGMPNIVSGFAVGECGFNALVPNPAPSGPKTHISVPSGTHPGYWLAGADGGVFALGAPFYGSTAQSPPAQPVAGIAATPGGGGYCLTAGNGQVFSAGPHPEVCAASPVNLNAPVVGIAAAPQGDGGYLAAADGGVFNAGTAPFYGSAGSLKLNKPVVGIATTPFGNGYDLVASDGGVFTYGPGAAFHGSAGSLKLNAPVVGMVVDPMTGGYWLVAADGGVFAYGAPYLGSMGGRKLNKPVVGIAAAPTGDGYYLVASDGGIFAFGTGAHFQGSTGSLKLVSPIVGMALG